MKGVFTMKKWIVFILSVLMILSLVSCSSQGDDSTSVSQTTKEGSETEIIQNSSEQLSEESEESSVEASVEELDVTEGKTLVVYYSATGYTESVANYIAEATDGELFELKPVEEYSRDDLDWTDRDSRVSREHENPDERVVDLVTSTVSDWESYDTIFIGYPKFKKVNYIKFL